MRKNKFEVSKIYMTACMCIYKFCQIKRYLFMIFSCFIQKSEGYIHDSLCFIQDLECFITFKKNVHILLSLKNIYSRFFMFYSRFWMMFYYILFKKHSCFINDFHEIFKIIHILLKILNDFLLYVFMKCSCFSNDFDDIFKIFQDFSRFYIFYSRSWMIFYYIFLKQVWSLKNLYDSLHLFVYVLPNQKRF